MPLDRQKKKIVLVIASFTYTEKIFYLLNWPNTIVVELDREESTEVECIHVATCCLFRTPCAPYAI